MADLKVYFNTDYGSVSFAMSAQGIGMSFGASLAGLIVDASDKLKDTIVLASMLLTFSITLSMSCASSLYILWDMFWLNGCFTGAMNVVGHELLCEMWGKTAASVMYLPNIGFGIGALATPLVVTNVLAMLKFQDSPAVMGSLNIMANASFGTTGNAIDNAVVQATRVRYTFIILGVLEGILYIPFIIYIMRAHCRKSNVNKVFKKDFIIFKAERKSTDTYFHECSRDVTLLNGIQIDLPGMVKKLSLMFFLINVFGGEMLLGNFVRTFSVDVLNFSQDEATYLNTAYWASVTFGWIMCSILSNWISVKYLFVTNIALYALTVTLLDIFSSDSRLILWICTVLVGFLVAQLYPACILFATKYIDGTDRTLPSVYTASGFGYCLYIGLAGTLYNNYGLIVILYIMQTSVILLLISMAIIMVFTRQKEQTQLIQEHEIFRK